MHTLFPPLQDKEETTPRTDSDSENHNNHDDNVLSQELKENFDTMRALLSGTSDETAGRKRGDDNHDSHESRKKHKREQQAVKTALAVESEIARLRGGIAELEALLLEVGDSDVPLVVFPNLPPVVPDEPANNEQQQREESEKKTGKLVQG